MWPNWVQTPTGQPQISLVRYNLLASFQLRPLFFHFFFFRLTSFFFSLSHCLSFSLPVFFSFLKILFSHFFYSELNFSSTLPSLENIERRICSESCFNCHSATSSRETSVTKPPGGLSQPKFFNLISKLFQDKKAWRIVLAATYAQKPTYHPSWTIGRNPTFLSTHRVPPLNFWVHQLYFRSTKVEYETFRSFFVNLSDAMQEREN